jgi:RNA polymerase sigma-70 factor (ECF subfamily)
VQAAIQAVHADTIDGGRTDWRQVLDLYDLLLRLWPSPVVALNRAVAVAEVDGPLAALAVVDGLDLGRYQPFHVVRADLLERVGDPDGARQAWSRALELTVNPVERAHLDRRRKNLAL